MTKYTELQETIRDMQEQLESLADDLYKAQQELKKLKGWKGTTPEKGDEFYFISGDGRICLRELTDGSMSRSIIQCHNYFKTREEGQAELERITLYRRLKKIADRLNKEENIDWSNSCQLKYSIEALYTRNYSNIRLIQKETFSQVQAGAIYCLRPNFLETAIKDIGEEELKKFILNER